MRIAIVSETWAPSVDGVVTRLENTVRELRSAGHEVLVVAPTTGSAVWGVVERQTRTVSFDFLYGGRPWGLPGRRVTGAVDEFRPDVVHVVNPVFMGAWAIRAARRHYPLIVSYHTDVAAYAGHYHLGWLRPLIHRLMRSMYRSATVRLATSDVGREQLFQLGIDDVELWARGVDHKLFRPDRDGSAMRERLAADPDLPLALYVGRLASEKGCQHMLDLATSDPPVQVAFVGDGPDRRRLERMFAGTRCHFTGFLSGDDLADAYAAADVFVFPSETDTLGLVLLEAMATGLPIVARDTPTARHTLEGYPSVALALTEGLPATLTKAVHQVLDDPAEDCDDDPPGDEGDDDPRPPRRAGRSSEGDWLTVTEQLLSVYEKARRTAARRGEIGRHRRVSRFVAVGASNAAVDLAVFNAMVFAHPTRSSSLLVAYNTIAVMAALFNSYLWNSRWTFRDRAARRAGGRWRQRWLFLLQGGINLAVNDITILILAQILTPILGLPTTIASNSAKVGAMLTASAVSFALMHLWVFRHHPGGGGRPANGR